MSPRTLNWLSRTWLKRKSSHMWFSLTNGSSSHLSRAHAKLRFWCKKGSKRRTRRFSSSLGTLGWKNWGCWWSIKICGRRNTDCMSLLLVTLAHFLTRLTSFVAVICWLMWGARSIYMMSTTIWSFNLRTIYSTCHLISRQSKQKNQTSFRRCLFKTI